MRISDWSSDVCSSDLKEAKDVMASQFAEVANKLLGEAQKSFLERAQQRFTQAGESNEAKLKALLQPVEHTLKRYEENVAKVETERKEAYRSEEHPSELQSLMPISHAVLCLNNTI